jgi:serine/threonine protein kinase
MSDYKGKMIGEYQIVDLVDDASKVLVFKGTQPNLGRDVAIKVLKPHAAKDQTVVQAYTQYAKLAATIQHPNILAVLDSGEDSNILYLVTPYLENKSVADNMPRFMDTNLAVELIYNLIPGLQYLYNKGYVHGNLRPSNILLDQEMRPLLTNFGFAFRQKDEPGPYTSPEEMKGGMVDQRTDVYALGVILYTLLVGHAPSPGAVLNLSSVRPDVPQGVAQAILKATTQDPDQRFQSASAFGEELKSASLPVAAAPQPQAAPQQAPPKKGSSGMGVVMGVLIGLAVFMCALFVVPRIMDAMNDQSGAPTEAAPPPEATEPPPVEQPTDAPEPTNVPEPTDMPEPTEAPPEPGQPIEDLGGKLGEICNSLGLAGGIVIMGGGAAVLQRRKKRKNQI